MDFSDIKLSENHTYKALTAIKFKITLLLHAATHNKARNCGLCFQGSAAARQCPPAPGATTRCGLGASQITLAASTKQMAITVMMLLVASITLWLVTR